MSFLTHCGQSFRNQRCDCGEQEAEMLDVDAEDDNSFLFFRVSAGPIKVWAPLLTGAAQRFFPVGSAPMDAISTTSPGTLGFAEPL